MRKCTAWICSLILACSMLVSEINTYDVIAAGREASWAEAPLSPDEREWVDMARAALQEILAERTAMALVYLTDNYPVRQSADGNSAVVATVPSGQMVRILDVEMNGAYEVWEYVTFHYAGQQYYGYVLRSNLACSDEKFLDWETEYGMNPADWAVMTLNADVYEYHSYSMADTGSVSDSDADDGTGSVSDSDAGDDSGSVSDSDAGDGSQGGSEDGNDKEEEPSIRYPDIEQFPESYKEALTELKEAHPNWTFVKMNTNLDWDVVVQNQMVKGRNLIPASFPEYMWDGLYGQGWAYVTEETLKYYLDPRNGLTEEGIFQFEQLTYNASYHTEEAVQAFLNNTFMSGIIPNTVLTYSYAIYKIGEELGVSPFHLACRIYQEQGKGTSPLISGTYPGYEGYYNYFNIGASGSTNEAVIVSGLSYAKKQGWTDGYHSIYGGAKILASNYILHGQDTLYLQKFDVDSSYDGLYWHQYMQNVCAPSSEGKNIRKSYLTAGSLDNTFVFKIPVYNNMPGETSEAPSISYEVSLTAPEGYADATIYLDGIPYQAIQENGSYIMEAADGNAKTAIMYQYNEKGVPVGMYVWQLNHDGTKYEITEVPELENLLSYHGFSIRITGKTGIRFKTGIGENVRKQLIETGLAGYTLKEYGTLVMNNANRDQYPLIKDGQKVLSGLSYGVNTSGVLEDKIYETVDGRHRYTSVLVGLPVAQYQTEFAFRGYIILTKDGQDITLYGPTVYRSIYNLAKQLLNLGQYAEGSSADLFLKQLISDADAANAQ